MWSGLALKGQTVHGWTSTETLILTAQHERDRATVANTQVHALSRQPMFWTASSLKDDVTFHGLPGSPWQLPLALALLRLLPKYCVYF
eukprot:953105-Amphidinium_carterae.1